MKIRNEEDLANVLGMAFRTYSADIARGKGLEPFKAFIDGAHTIIAEIAISDRGEVAIYTSPVVPLLNVSTPIPTEVFDNLMVEETPEEGIIIEPVTEVTEETKPKRKRKNPE